MLNMTSFDVSPASILARRARRLLEVKETPLLALGFIHPPPFHNPPPPLRAITRDVLSHYLCAYYKLEPVSGSSICEWNAPVTSTRHEFFTVELTSLLSMGFIKSNRALWCVLSRILRAVRLRKLNSTNPEGAPQRRIYLQINTLWSKHTSPGVFTIPACW